MTVLLHRFLLRLFPAAWRARYASEFTALLAERPLRIGDVADIIGAAVDARLHPQLRPTPILAAASVEPELRMVPALQRSFGIMPGPPVGDISRRRFLRRMLGVGTALLSIEFLGGTLAFLWPQFRSGLGAKFRVGRLADIAAAQPSFVSGWPYAFAPARVFLVNVPAAKALASGSPVSIPDPTADELLALWRRCPHLGCQVPQLCDSLKRYTCLCHGSTYNILGEKLKEGPAERGMDRFPVSIDEDGVVVIDTATVIAGAPNLGPAYLTFVDPFPYDVKCQ